MNDGRVFLRQLDLVTPKELDFTITVIGAGGIGSWTTLALAKIGCRNITVVDFDNVEAKNTPSQLYTLKQIGKPKVEALAELVEMLTGVQITPIKSTYQDYLKKEKKLTHVVISSVDSIAERQKIWKVISEIYEKEQTMECYIDARMGGELIRDLVVNPRDKDSVEYYNKKLFAKKKHHEEPCTAKAIAYNTFMAAGVLASIVKKFAKRQEVKYDFYMDIVNMEVY